MRESPVPEVLEVDSLEQFDALLSPRRLHLLEVLEAPRSAKEAAEELGVPVTRLYYHLNALLEHGLIEVVEERSAGAMVERVFRVAGRIIRPSQAFLARYGNEGLAEVVTLAFRQAEAQFAGAVREGRVGLEPADKSRTSTIGFVSVRVTPERLIELIERSEALLGEFLRDEGDVRVSVFQAIHPRGDHE